MSKKKRIEALEKRIGALEDLVINYISSQMALKIADAVEAETKAIKKTTKKAKGRPKKEQTNSEPKKRGRKPKKEAK